MWEAVETGAREIGVGKAEGRRGKGGSREKERRKEEKTVETENNRSKKSSGGVGDMG